MVIESLKSWENDKSTKRKKNENEKVALKKNFKKIEKKRIY